MINARSSRNREKLCWNCQGSIPLSSAECKFCGSQVDFDQSNSSQSAVKKGEPQDPTHPFHFLYQQQLPENIPPEEPPAEIEESNTNSNSSFLDQQPRVSIYLLAVLAGSSLIFFSAILILYGHEGVLFLQWSTATWPIYLLLGLASFVWGCYSSRNRN
jgi:hypothetical protein